MPLMPHVTTSIFIGPFISAAERKDSGRIKRKGHVKSGLITRRLRKVFGWVKVKRIFRKRLRLRILEKISGSPLQIEFIHKRGKINPLFQRALNCNSNASITVALKRSSWRSGSNYPWQLHWHRIPGPEQKDKGRVRRQLMPARRLITRNGIKPPGIGSFA